MRRILHDKRGISYIWCCVLILIAVMLIMIGMQYARIYHVADVQKEQTKLMLDSYITKYAVENFDAVKQGENFSHYIDEKDLVSGAYASLNLPEPDGQPIRVVKEMYTLTAFQISPLTNREFGVIFKYRIIIPFEMFHRKIADITVPVTIVSAYKQK